MQRISPSFSFRSFFYYLSRFVSNYSEELYIHMERRNVVVDSVVFGFLKEKIERR